MTLPSAWLNRLFANPGVILKLSSMRDDLEQEMSVGATKNTFQLQKAIKKSSEFSISKTAFLSAGKNTRLCPANPLVGLIPVRPARNIDFQWDFQLHDTFHHFFDLLRI